jgi:hypothetical protein
MAGNIGVFGLSRSSFLPEDKGKPSAQSPHFSDGRTGCAQLVNGGAQLVLESGAEGHEL